jgi:hypothetical protein
MSYLEIQDMNESIFCFLVQYLGVISHEILLNQKTL